MSRFKPEIGDGYFVPTPPEIHVGMEYEHFHRGTWQKKSINDLLGIIKVFNGIQKDRVRVPVLSEAVFTNEGWVKDGDTFTKNNFTLTYVGDRLEVFYKETRVFAGKCVGLNKFHSICRFVGV